MVCSSRKPSIALICFCFKNEISVGVTGVPISNDGVFPVKSTVKRYLLNAFSRRGMSFVLFSVAIKRHHDANGSRVPVCPIFFVSKVFLNLRITSKLLRCFGLSIR